MSMDGNVANLMGMARTAMIGGNNVEAHAYFNRVLEIDPSISEAWLGKGKAAGWQSTLVNIRLAEATIAFNHAIANAEPSQRDAVTAEAVTEVNRIVVALYGLARDHMVEYVSLDNIWAGYLNHVSQLIDALEEVRKWSPYDRNTLDNIVHFCKDNIEGYSYRDKFNQNMPAAQGISGTYEQFLRERMDQAVEAIRASDPNYAPPAIEKKKAEACFVVTATMGDFDHPEVVLLRQFRDAWLRKQPGGKALASAYYRVGPFFAAAIDRSALLKRISYRVIVAPAARFARRKMR